MPQPITGSASPLEGIRRVAILSSLGSAPRPGAMPTPLPLPRLRHLLGMLRASGRCASPQRRGSSDTRKPSRGFGIGIICHFGR